MFLFKFLPKVTGSAGCQERHDSFGPATNYTAFRSTDYGYTRMQVFNATHLHIQQVSDDQVNIMNFFFFK